MFSEQDINKIKHDIRNIRTLTNEQKNIIKKLSRDELLEIIELYNNVVEIVSDLMSQDYSSNSTLHTKK